MSAPPPSDPPSTATATATAATATTRLFSSTLPPQRPQTQPNSLQRLPQQQHHHYIQTPRIHQHHPQQQKNQDPHHQNNNSNSNVLYPVASSGRGFLPRPLPSAARNNITTTPPYPPYPFQPPSYGLTPHSDPHLAIRPPTQYFPGGPTGMLPLNMVRGFSVSTNPKVAASPTSVSDGNGSKDIRERSRDDNVATIRDRKVKFSEGSSLYSLCRSWVKNGISEENKPQYTDSVKSLPKPLPAPVTDANSQLKKKDEKEEVEDVEDVDNLSSKELLQGHIKRAKKVRARLREERLQRIARYKGRLALLLPPVVEQQLKNDSASAN